MVFEVPIGIWSLFSLVWFMGFGLNSPSAWCGGGEANWRGRRVGTWYRAFSSKLCPNGSSHKIATNENLILLSCLWSTMLINFWKGSSPLTSNGGGRGCNCANNTLLELLLGKAKKKSIFELLDCQKLCCRTEPCGAGEKRVEDLIFLAAPVTFICQSIWHAKGIVLHARCYWLGSFTNWYYLLVASAFRNKSHDADAKNAAFTTLIGQPSVCRFD
jgi:hypothetical protein